MLRTIVLNKGDLRHLNAPLCVINLRSNLANAQADNNKSLLPKYAFRMVSPVHQPKIAVLESS